MNIIIAAVVILIISFVWALLTSGRETSVPEELKRIRVSAKKKKMSGVIIFLRDRVIHYHDKGS